MSISIILIKKRDFRNHFNLLKKLILFRALINKLTRKLYLFHQKNGIFISFYYVCKTKSSIPKTNIPFLFLEKNICSFIFNIIRICNLYNLKLRFS